MKVRITQHDPVPGQSECFVFSPTGDYDSFDLVEVYVKENPDVSNGALQAQYVKFGPVVYREDEYTELLKQLDVIKEAEPTVDEIISQNASTVAEPVDVEKNPQPEANDSAPYTVL